MQAFLILLDRPIDTEYQYHAAEWAAFSLPETNKRCATDGCRRPIRKTFAWNNPDSHDFRLIKSPLGSETQAFLHQLIAKAHDSITKSNSIIPGEIANRIESNRIESNQTGEKGKKMPTGWMDVDTLSVVQLNYQLLVRGRTISSFVVCVRGGDFFSLFWRKWRAANFVQP